MTVLQQCPFLNKLHCGLLTSCLTNIEPNFPSSVTSLAQNHFPFFIHQSNLHFSRASLNTAHRIPSQDSGFLHGSDRWQTLFIIFACYEHQVGVWNFFLCELKPLSLQKYPPHSGLPLLVCVCMCFSTGWFWSTFRKQPKNLSLTDCWETERSTCQISLWRIEPVKFSVTTYLEQ